MSLAIVALAVSPSDVPAAPDEPAEKSVTSADGVVHLPPYRMVYLPPFLSTAVNHLRWRYVAIPGSEILSCCDDDITERFVRWAYLNQELLEAIMPEDLRVRNAVPTALILLSEKALPPEIAPIARERSREMSVQLAKLGTPAMLDPSRSIPQIFLHDADSDGGDIAWSARSRGFEFDPEHLFFVLAGRKPPPPLWFVEGMLNFRYPSPSGNFQIKAFEEDAEFDPNEEYDDAVVIIHPAVWVSGGVRTFLRLLLASSSDDKAQDHLRQLLIQRMLPLRKVLTKAPPRAGEESRESPIERQMLPIRTLFASPPPPDGSAQEKNMELDDGGVDAAKLANMENLNANAAEQEQVRFLLERGADEASPWRYDVWTAQLPLLEQLVFDGMPIKRVLTEAPPGPASEEDKESWFAQAGLGLPAGNKAEPGLLRHRAQLILRDGSDPGSPWQLDIWKAQAALFVRWAFDDPTRTRREALWKLVRYASRAPVTEQVFQDFFGLTFDQMDRRLCEYLPTAIDESFVLFPPGSFRIPAVDKNALSEVLGGGEVPELKLRDPTPAEKGRILGDWERKEVDFVREALPEYANLYLMQTRSTLLNAYNGGSRDPSLLAALGLFECTAGDDDAARGFLEAAVGAHVVRPRAYVELARIRLAAALAAPGGAGEKLNAWQMTSVLELLRTAREQAPPLLATYMTTAEVLQHAGAPPAPADRAMLAEGLNLFPFDEGLRAAAAPFAAAR